MNDDFLGDLAIYKMMADETKLRILKTLSEGERCVGDLIAYTGSSQPLVSHKLKDLRENGLVVSFRSGKNIIYRLADNSITSVISAGENAGHQIQKNCNCVECEEDARITGKM